MDSQFARIAELKAELKDVPGAERLIAVAAHVVATGTDVDLGPQFDLMCAWIRGEKPEECVAGPGIHDVPPRRSAANE